jgi:nitroreductase/NAD-dependent dihydropyrimidine dehydrogenase PreA subunit
MPLIKVNEEKCTKCSICIQSCPVSIISAGENKIPFVDAENEKACIYCGHCETVCPQDALTHSLSAKAMLPLTNELDSIDPQKLGKYFRHRRSIRNYQNKPVDRKILEEIMDIVRYAPTGTNRQFNQWIMVYNKEMVKQLAAGTIEWMKALYSTNPEMAGRYNVPAMVAAFEKGNDRICRNAPHLVIAYTPAKYPLGVKDATIATAHFELLAPSFGLGACWAGFLMMALQFSPEMKKLIGLDENYTVHAALMVGYPKYKYYKVPARNKPNMNWI